MVSHSTPKLGYRRLDGPYCLSLAFRWAYMTSGDVSDVIGHRLSDAEQVGLFAAFLGGSADDVVCAWDGKQNIAADLRRR